MTKYVIVSFVQEPKVKSFHVSEWPLHLTLVGVFFSEKESNELFELIGSACMGQAPFKIEGKSKELFAATPNSDRGVSVTEVEKISELANFHEKLVSSLELHIVFKAEQYNREGYRPHITDQKAGVFEPGEAFEVTSISLLCWEDETWHIEKTHNLLG